jgi:hypothetical protein
LTRLCGGIAVFDPEALEGDAESRPVGRAEVGARI